ncbi:MAG: DNA repair protein RadC [Bacteroidetes bacterium]|nr:MAG: DNA repair protein RadC [Bacteroidota bacterium]
MKKYIKHITIKQWAEEDRPREKLMLKGRHALSDAELVAILIGSGTAEHSAVEIAKELLHDVHDNLIDLGKLSIHDLMKYRGLGKARAITIAAALELGKRRNEAVTVEKAMICRSDDAYRIFRSVLGDQPYEEFWILILNRANRLVKKSCISEGGISGTVVDPKKIFKIALDHHASGIILGHNHPSGNTKPSESDIKITGKILEAGKLLEVSVLDHLIVSEEGFFSFADQGML